MEIAGLAIGAAGLATLFSGCMDAFDRVHVARTQDSALRILSTKLENQKVRFIIWGQSLGLDSTDGYDPQLDHPIRRDSIRRTMTLVHDLFMEGESLQTRYGLRKEESEAVSTVAVYDPKLDQSVWKDFFRKIRVKAKKQKQQQHDLQKTPSLQSKSSSGESEGNVVRWMISDRTDFMSLVANLRELIDDLESMCKFADINGYRRMRVTWEIESMGDTESLHLIRAATENDDDAMSIAASQRLDELEYPSDKEPALPQYLYSGSTEIATAGTQGVENIENGRDAGMAFEDFIGAQDAVDIPRYYTPPGFPQAQQPRPRSRSRSRSRHRSKSRSPPARQDGNTGSRLGLGLAGAAVAGSAREQYSRFSIRRGPRREERDSVSPAIRPSGSRMAFETRSDATAQLTALMGDAGPLLPSDPPALAGFTSRSGSRRLEPIIHGAAEFDEDIHFETEEAQLRNSRKSATLPSRPGRYQRVAEQVREQRATRTRRGRRQFSSIQESDEEDEQAYWVPRATRDGLLYYQDTQAPPLSSTEKPAQEPASSEKDDGDQTSQERTQISTQQPGMDKAHEDANSNGRDALTLRSASPTLD